VRLMLMWPSYALGRAAVRACCGRRTRSVELLCVPVVAVVRARWSFCARLLLWPPYALGGACQNKEASGDEEASRDEEASGDEEASRDEEASGHD